MSQKAINLVSVVVILSTLDTLGVELRVDLWDLIYLFRNTIYTAIASPGYPKPERIFLIIQKEEFKERRNLIAKSGHRKQSRQQLEIYAHILKQSGRQHSNAYNRPY